MIGKTWSAHLGLAAVCFGGVGVLIYGVMITVTLTHLEAVSGQVPFDMRPLGYNPQDAAALLDGLGAEGRRYYLRAQIPLDMLYPALLAFTLVSVLRWLGQSMSADRLVRVGVVLSVGAALCDYLENLCIVAMILRGPDLSAQLVYASSSATIAKSGLTTMAMGVIILLGACAAVRRVRRAA